MKLSLIIASLTVAGSHFGLAQNGSKTPKANPRLDANSEFNNRDKAVGNEVKVVLDPVGEPLIPKTKERPVAEPVQQANPSAKPVREPGKPQEADSELSPEKSGNSPDASADAAPELSIPQPGLEVRVEKLQTGMEFVDPKTIKLLAPFPAKPLASPPPGWHLVASENAPPFTRKVEIAPGSEITLTIRPHLLVPDSDGSKVFSVSESGYEPSLGYQQTSTVGAILSNSIRQLDEDSKHLGDAIDRLQQLLISLPKPQPLPQPEQKSESLPARKP